MGETAQPPGTQFRWQFVDDTVGQDWTDWHEVDGPCEACCCDGPEYGEHLHAAGFYTADGFIELGNHVRLDPRDIEEWVTVEWRTEPP